MDDETDEDTMAALLDKHLPPGVVMCNGSRVPGGRPALANAQVCVTFTVPWYFVLLLVAAVVSGGGKCCFCRGAGLFVRSCIAV